MNIFQRQPTCMHACMHAYTPRYTRVHTYTPTMCTMSMAGRPLQCYA